jgi:hypothetical protein
VINNSALLTTSFKLQIWDTTATAQNIVSGLAFHFEVLSAQ